MSADSLTKDSKSREKIIKEINTNFFVEAGAGSGKTTMLVNRMVAMVESGIPIDRICAITFTKAAANEFYERFQKMLSERANLNYEYVAKGYAGELPAPTDETRARCQKALNDIDLCFMGTIDSFCYMILKEHPTEAKIPSNATLITEDAVSELYRQEYVKICQGKYGDELEQLSKVFRRVNSYPEETFLRLIYLLMENRNIHFNYVEIRELEVDKTFKQDKEKLIWILGTIAKHKEAIYTVNKDSAATVDKIEYVANTVRKTWSNHFTDVLYSIKNIASLRINENSMEKLGFEDEEIFVKVNRKSAFQLTLNSDNCIINRLENWQYNITMTFVTKCVPIMEQVLRDQGAVTFFDCLYYLRNMLARDAAADGRLIQYIYNRHSYFLIDEFQDTNPMQAEVFFYLAAKELQTDWKACVPKPGSIFIVGDPKQSIYRFRGADVASFLTVKGLFTGEVGEVLELSRNFRSARTMCAYFNQYFSKILPEETENQSKYEEIPLPEDRWATEFQGAYKYELYTGGPEGDEHYGETDVAKVGQIIQGLVENPKYVIRAKEDKIPRPIRYSDFMIISKSKKQLPDFMKYFNDIGIPYKVEGKVAFDDCPALNEICNIYMAAIDWKDQISLYAALTGKVFGFTEEELLAYMIAEHKIALFDDVTKQDSDPEDINKVKEAIVSLKEFGNRIKVYSPANLFSEIMTTFKIYQYADNRNLEVVYYTLELLREAEKTHAIASLKDGADYLAGLLDGTNEVERCLRLKEEDNVVHIANLHKVKGLEAPIVILSYGSNKTRTANLRIEHDTCEGYLFKLSKGGDKNGNYITTKQFDDNKQDETASLKAEQKRLAYVGATRARNALIICNSRYWRSDLEKYIEGSAWKELTDGVADFFDTVELRKSDTPTAAASVQAETLYQQAEESCVLNNRSSEEETYTVMLPSHVAHSKMEEMPVDESAEDEQVIETAPSEKVSVVHRFPTLIGTMTHKLMEVLVSSSDAADLAQTINEIISEFMVEEAAPYEKHFREALTAVGQTMRTSGYPQTNGLPRQMLQELLTADEVYCEVPFCYKNADADKPEIWNGIMDVIYCKAGKWHIVDYKTNLDGTGLDALYANQLDAYRTAFKKMTGEDADAFTYHIAI